MRHRTGLAANVSFNSVIQELLEVLLHIMTKSHMETVSRQCPAHDCQELLSRIFFFLFDKNEMLRGGIQSRKKETLLSQYPIEQNHFSLALYSCILQIYQIRSKHFYFWWTCSYIFIFFYLALHHKHFIFFYCSIFYLCYLFGRQRERDIFHSFPQMPEQLGLGQAGGRSQRPHPDILYGWQWCACLDCHLLPSGRYALGGSWNYTWSQDSNPSALLWDVGIHLASGLCTKHLPLLSWCF